MIVKGKNMEDVKQENRAAVLKLLHICGPMSRKEIAARLNLTPAAITTIIAQQIEHGLVREVGEKTDPQGKRHNVGRREILVELDGDHYVSVGVSFGKNAGIISAMNLRGELLVSEAISYDIHSGADHIIGKACRFLERTIQQLEQQGKICVGIGVVARGVVDERTQMCTNSHGAWLEEFVDLVAPVQKALPGYPVYTRQNVRALAQTYLFEQSAEEIESMLFVKNGTGIGASIVLNHKVYMGYHGNCSEMGHITVDRQGKPCQCGSRGCLETVSSCAAIEQTVAALFGVDTTPILWEICDGRPERVGIGAILSAVEYGDTQVKAAVDHAIREFAVVIRGLMDTLDVQKVVFHGEIFHFKYFLQKLKEEINFDDRYPLLESILETTSYVQELESKASPVLAIEAFYQSGGKMERSFQ